jgi:lipoate-protein ligase A
MRLPFHDTLLSLPAEPPAQAIAADEALLDLVKSTGEPQERWWIAASPAVVVGLGLHHRLASVVDLARCRAAGVSVLTRRAGGGALLLDANMVCGAICVPIDGAPTDVTESYRWPSDQLVDGLRECGVSARRVEVDEARDDVARLRAATDDVSRLLLSACYGALSPHEIVVGRAKLVGLAQVRRRHAALYQFGILLQDQSRLADYLVVHNAAEREELRARLRERTVGLCVLESSSNWQHAQPVP